MVGGSISASITKSRRTSRISGNQRSLSHIYTKKKKEKIRKFRFPMLSQHRHHIWGSVLVNSTIIANSCPSPAMPIFDLLLSIFGIFCVFCLIYRLKKKSGEEQVDKSAVTNRTGMIRLVTEGCGRCPIPTN